MKTNKGFAAATVHRRLFLRNAATAAGAVALAGSPAASAETAATPAAAGGRAAVRRLRQSAESAAAWQEFQEQLARSLPGLSEDEYLVISRKRTNQFVQFVAQGHYGIRAEAGGNEFLESAAQLSNESIAHLVAMGWHAPTYELNSKPAGEEEPPDGSCNFYLDVAVPVPYGELAALAVETFRVIYRIGHPGFLEYTARSMVDSRVSIRFPSLGVKRDLTP